MYFDCGFLGCDTLYTLPSLFAGSYFPNSGRRPTNKNTLLGKLERVFEASDMMFKELKRERERERENHFHHNITGKKAKNTKTLFSEGRLTF